MSLVLLPLFEVEANRETGTYYGDRIFGAFATQLRSSRSDSRQDLFITCSIEASTECRIHRFARQRVDSSATPARLRQGKWYEISLSFLLSRSSLFLRCTLRLGVRWRHNSLHSRPSTLPSLYIARNGRNRGSRGKELSWSQPIKRLAELLERECSRAPGTSYLMALPSKHIRSGVSSRARSRRSRFRLS